MIGQFGAVLRGGLSRRGGSGPRVDASRSPDPPHWRATISAAIDTAVSSGVRAPRSRPIGDDSSASSRSDSPGLDQPLHPLVVGAPRPHRADVARAYVVVEPQRHLEERDVELRVVRQHRQHRAPVDAARVELGLRGSGAASRPRPRRRPGSARWWRRRGGRRRRSRGSRGTTRPWPRRRRSRSHRRPASAASARSPRRRPACPRRGARRPGRRSAWRWSRPPGCRARRRGRRRRPGASRCSPRPRRRAGRPSAGRARPGPGARSPWRRPPDGRPRCRRRPRRAAGKVVRETCSTKTSRMPPQVRPTAKASSSETPYRSSTGSPEATTDWASS